MDLRRQASGLKTSHCPLLVQTRPIASLAEFLFPLPLPALSYKRIVNSSGRPDLMTDPPHQNHCASRVLGNRDGNITMEYLT